jgi:hypothetical protein
MPVADSSLIYRSSCKTWLRYRLLIPRRVHIRQGRRRLGHVGKWLPATTPSILLLPWQPELCPGVPKLNPIQSSLQVALIAHISCGTTSRHNFQEGESFIHIDDVLLDELDLSPNALIAQAATNNSSTATTTADGAASSDQLAKRKRGTATVCCSTTRRSGNSL